MPQFEIGATVITRTHGTGIVRSIFPGSKASGTPPHYAVEVDGSRHAVVFTEGELSALGSTDTAWVVHCRDCARGKPSLYTQNVRHCAVFRRLRSANAARICKHFIPLTDKQGG